MSIKQRILFKICDQDKFKSGYHDSDIFHVDLDAGSNYMGFVFKGTDAKWYLAAHYYRMETPFIPAYEMNLSRHDITTKISDSTTTSGSFEIPHKLTQTMNYFNDEPQYIVDDNYYNIAGPTMLFKNDNDSKWTFGIPTYCKNYTKNTSNDLFNFNPEWLKSSNDTYRWFCLTSQKEVSVYSALPYKGIWTSSTIDGTYTVNYSSSDYTVDRYYYPLGDDTAPGDIEHDYSQTYYKWAMEITEYDLDDFKALAGQSSYANKIYSCDTKYGIYENINDDTDFLAIGAKSYQVNFENTSESYDLKNIITNVDKSDYVTQTKEYETGSTYLSGDDFELFNDERSNDRFVLKKNFTDNIGWYTNTYFSDLTGTITGTYGHYDGLSWVSGDTLSGDAYITLSGYTEPSSSEPLMNYNTVVYTNISGDYSSFTPSASADLTDCNYHTYLMDILAKTYIRSRLMRDGANSTNYNNLAIFYDINKQINVNGIPSKWNQKLKENLFDNYTKTLVNDYINDTSGNIVWKGPLTEDFSYDSSSISVDYTAVDALRTSGGMEYIKNLNIRVPQHVGNVNCDQEQKFYNNILSGIINTQYNVNDYSRYSFDLNGNTISDRQYMYSSNTNYGESTNSLTEAITNAQGESNKHPLGYTTYSPNQELSQYARVYTDASNNTYYCEFFNQKFQFIYPDFLKMFGVGEETDITYISAFENVSDPSFYFGDYTQDESEGDSYDNSLGLFTTTSSDCYHGWSYPRSGLGVSDREIPFDNLYSANDPGYTYFYNTMTGPSKLNGYTFGQHTLPIVSSKCDVTTTDSCF